MARPRGGETEWVAFKERVCCQAGTGCSCRLLGLVTVVEGRRGVAAHPRYEGGHARGKDYRRLLQMMVHELSVHVMSVSGGGGGERNGHTIGWISRIAAVSCRVKNWQLRASEPLGVWATDGYSVVLVGVKIC